MVAGITSAFREDKRINLVLWNCVHAHALIVPRSPIQRRLANVRSNCLTFSDWVSSRQPATALWLIEFGIGSIVKLVSCGAVDRIIARNDFFCESQTKVHGCASHRSASGCPQLRLQSKRSIHRSDRRRCEYQTECLVFSRLSRFHQLPLYKIASRCCGCAVLRGLEVERDNHFGPQRALHRWFSRSIPVSRGQCVYLAAMQPVPFSHFDSGTFSNAARREKTFRADGWLFLSWNKESQKGILFWGFVQLAAILVCGGKVF